MAFGIGKVYNLLDNMVSVGTVVQFYLLLKDTEPLFGGMAAGHSRTYSPYSVIGHGYQNAIHAASCLSGNIYMYMPRSVFGRYPVFDGILAVGMKKHGGKKCFPVHVRGHVDIVLQLLTVTQFFQLQITPDVIHFFGHGAGRPLYV